MYTINIKIRDSDQIKWNVSYWIFVFFNRNGKYYNINKRYYI